MGVMLSEGRARMIASETPMTWRQVILLGYRASEEWGSWEFRHWLLWSNPAEAGEYLFEFWMDQGGDEWEEDPRGDDLRLLAERGCRPKLTPQERYRDRGGPPATARAVGQTWGRMGCSAATGSFPSLTEE